jgi:hypothetical protein
VTVLELTCNSETRRPRPDDDNVGADVLNPCSQPRVPNAFWVAKTADRANGGQATTRQRNGDFLSTGPARNTVQNRARFIGAG